jgi:hypothetical protein
LPRTAGLLPFISFSTSYRELDSAVRRTMRRIGNGSSSDNTRPLDCTGGSVITLRGRRAGGLLPRCYQDRTNQSHQAPCREHPVWWFPVGLGWLRLDFLKFVNRRSSRSGNLKLEGSQRIRPGTRSRLELRESPLYQETLIPVLVPIQNLPQSQ